MTDVVTTAPVVEQKEPVAPVVAAAVTAVAEKPAAPPEGVSALLGDDSPEIKPASAWPDDWREQMAGEDKDALKILKRFTSPSSAARALVEAREKISKAGRIEKPADPADEKAMAEWRKAVGVPPSPDAYQVPKVDGVEWTDADKPILGQFFEYAHSKGLPQDAANVAVEWYANAQREIMGAQIEADKAASANATNELAGEWGAEFKANKTLAAKYLETVPDIGIGIAEFRGPDGRRLGDNPAFIRWCANNAREFYGDTAFVGANGSSTMGDRKAQLEKLMNTNFDEYERSGGPAEMRKIIDHEVSRSKR